MRRLLFATLLMAPLAFTASALAAPPASPNATTTTPADHPGATLPRLVYRDNLSIGSHLSAFVRPGSTFVVDVTIDAKGVPTQIDVVSSPLAQVNEDLINTVSTYRWSPGMLHGKPVASTERLVLQIQ